MKLLSKKSSCKYIDSKSISRKNVGLLLSGARDLVTRTMAKVLNIFFVQVFTG